MGLHILSVQPDDIVLGGVQVRSIEIAKYLRKRGIDTEFLVDKVNKNKKKGTFTLKAEQEGFIVHYYKSFPRPQKFKNIRSFGENMMWLIGLPISIYSAYNIISKNNYDIIHVNGLLNLSPILASKFTPKKVIWHLIGDHYPQFLIKLFRPFLNKLADKLIFIAERLRSYYLGSSCSDGEIIYEPVNLDKFSNNGSYREKLNNEFDIDNTNTIITSIGNIVPSKGWFYFVEAAEKIIYEFPNTKFLIVGAISENQKNYAIELHAWIKEKDLEDSIIFAGYRDDVPEILASSDIFMMASLLEGTPLAILEAMASKIPVIATNVGGISEQIIDGETGMIVESKNSDMLAKACKKLLAEKALQEEFVNKAYQRVINNFSLEICANRHSNLYSNLRD